MHQHIVLSVAPSPCQMLVSFRPWPLFNHGYVFEAQRNQEICVDSSWRSHQLSYQQLSGGVYGPTPRSNPQDPQFSASIHSLAAILLDMVFCLPIFPRRGRKGPQRGACGATAPRLTHPRIMDTGRQRLWSPSEAVVTTSLLSKRRELQHTKLRCTVEFPPGFNHSSPNTRRNQDARSYANYGW
jgi:hypothetical protein